MLTLRGLHWPHDREALCALDTSFTTERVYRVIAMTTGFSLHNTTVSPPLHKVYDLTDELERFPTFDHVVVAEHDARVAGVAALSYDAADRRVTCLNFYDHAK